MHVGMLSMFYSNYTRTSKQPRILKHKKIFKKKDHCNSLEIVYYLPREESMALPPVCKINTFFSYLDRKCTSFPHYFKGRNYHIATLFKWTKI